MRLTSLVAFTLVALVACGGYRGIREPLLTPYNSRWQRRLERTARADLACRAVRMIPLSETVLQADGCNRVAEYGLFCLGSRDCDWRAFEGVATRAARDLSCPDTSISVTASSAMQREVYGCGRVASYALTCAPQHCAWTPVAVSASVAAPVALVAVTASGEVVIPPPPGAEGTSGADGTSGAEVEVVIPPPPGAMPPASPTPASPAPTSTDDAVIPPPPR